MRTQPLFDIIIVGAGPSGLACARSLAGKCLRIALVDRTPATVLSSPPIDGREIALTHRSVKTLTLLGAWQRLGREDIAPLREARVVNGESRFALSFATPHPRDQLGYIVSNHRIRRTLYEAVEDQPGLTLFAGTAIRSVKTCAREASVLLGDGRELCAKLLIGGDSRFSLIRQELEIGAQINRLGRSMLVCRVGHESEHMSIATEWFGHGQTIAMLPLADGRTSSAVLTLPAAEVDRLAALDPDALGAELTRRFSARLGVMQIIEGPHVYPLVTTWSNRFAATRVALIGDAAVGMHPVTAHGFNLGLQGAAKLAALIGEAADRGRDIADGRVLRRYEAAHRLACAPLYAATNLLVACYADDKPLARIVRPLALRAAARLPLIRRTITRRLMQV